MTYPRPTPLFHNYHPLPPHFRAILIPICNWLYYSEIWSSWGSTSFTFRTTFRCVWNAGKSALMSCIIKGILFVEVQCKHGIWFSSDMEPTTRSPLLPLHTAYTFKWVLKWWVVAVGVGVGGGVLYLKQLLQLTGSQNTVNEFRSRNSGLKT